MVQGLPWYSTSSASLYSKIFVRYQSYRRYGCGSPQYQLRFIFFYFIYWAVNEDHGWLDKKQINTCYKHVIKGIKYYDRKCWTDIPKTLLRNLFIGTKTGRTWNLKWFQSLIDLRCHRVVASSHGPNNYKDTKPQMLSLPVFNRVWDPLPS